MANLYYTEEMKKIFDAKISGLVLEIANDETLTNDRIVNGLKEIRCYRKFADMIVEDMAAADMAEEQEKQELEEAGKAAREAYDNLFIAKTWKNAEVREDGADS